MIQRNSYDDTKAAPVFDLAEMQAAIEAKIAEANAREAAAKEAREEEEEEREVEKEAVEMIAKEVRDRVS